MYMGHTALQAASQNGQSDVVKLLIGYKADLEQEVTTSQYMMSLLCNVTAG